MLRQFNIKISSFKFGIWVVKQVFGKYNALCLLCHQVNVNVTFSPYWRCYYSNTDAIIYVVDSMDRDRIGISKQELVSMLEVIAINFSVVYRVLVCWPFT